MSKKEEILKSLEKLAKEANFGNYSTKDLYKIAKRALEKSIFQSSGKQVKIKSLEVPEEYKNYDVAQNFRKILRQSM